MDNKAHNAQVAAYLKDYLNDEGFAQFAVLLTGKWGSGKTHFILNLKDQYDAQSPHEKNITKTEINWVYVSLNGIDSIDEIEKRIFMAAHAWLNNTAVKLGKSFLGSIVASPPIYGIGFNTKNFMQDLKKLLPKVKNAAFIFDDVERCRLPLSNLFGYINNFVEHDKLKVIIVTDEDKLKEYYEKEKHNQPYDRGFSTYEQVKEKLIGQTLEIKPDIGGAFENLIQRITDIKIKNYIDRNKPSLINIFNQSGQNNLRSFKAAIFIFERLCNFLNEIAVERSKDDSIYFEQLSDLLQKITAITLMHRNGNILNLHTVKINDFPLSKRQNYNVDPKLTCLTTHFPNLNWLHTPIELSQLGLIIEKGVRPNVDATVASLHNDYKARMPKISVPTPSQNDISDIWIKLFNWQKMAPQAFRSALSEFHCALKRHAFKNFGDILQIAGLIDWLCENEYKFIPQNENLATYISNYMDGIENTAGLNFWNLLYNADPNSYKGYSILIKHQNPEVYNIILNRFSLLASQTDNPETQLIDLLTKDDYVGLNKHQFLLFPVLSYVDCDQYCNLINLEDIVNLKPFTALDNRYQDLGDYRENAQWVIDVESPWLASLRDSCLKKIASLEPPYISLRTQLIKDRFERIDMQINNTKSKLSR